MDTNEITRPTILEINLDNFKFNISQIKKNVGKDVEIMPVIKANGYGTYVNKRLDILNMFNIVAVATVDEGVYIRNLGYEKDIFLLNQAYETEIDKIIDNNIIVGVSSKKFMLKLAEYDKMVNIHIEIGTGMGRTGIHPDRVEEFIKLVPKNVHVDGVYTHMSSADIDDEYTKKQIKSFDHALNVVKQFFPKLRYIHAAASNAILNYPESHYNLVRPGIIIYGYPASENTLEKIQLRPIATLKSKITYIKEVDKGTSIGYGRSYITNKKTKVATVPIGYADGLRRDFSNGWKVKINNKKVPIIGKICMDSFMVDVTDIEDVNIGDVVFIWDNEDIKVEDLASKCGTINYEILCTISDRVPRKFLNEGRGLILNFLNR
ncbi:MAG: alanine racemase [Clostridia bacterium]|nr:alanine racemase [Clostridia bacterium]